MQPSRGASIVCACGTPPSPSKRTHRGRLILQFPQIPCLCGFSAVLRWAQLFDPSPWNAGVYVA